MNPSSQRMKSLIHTKLLITIILGLLILVPFGVTAQETTEEPQTETVVTEETVEEPVETTTEEAVTEEEVPLTETEETSTTPAPEITEQISDPVEVEVTEDVTTTDESTETVDVETTEEPAVEVVETEQSVIETPVVEITEFIEDFEAWTGDNWTLVDWTVSQLDNSFALVSIVSDASAEIMSLDWDNYSITVDVKVEAGNTLQLHFGDYLMTIATDGRNRLSQDDVVLATSPTVEPTDTVTWHTVNISKVGSALTITVDDVPQYTVETIDAPLGIFAFIATSDQGVAIDNLVMTELDDVETVEIIATPPPATEETEGTDVVVVIEATENVDPLAEVTEETDPLAETTEEADPLAETTEETDLLAEATEEADPLAEATEEADPLAEATAEVVAEVTEEAEYVVTNLITDDFEGDLSAWNTTASLVEVSENNHALLLSSNGQLSPARTIENDNFNLSGQANILNDGETPGNLSITFGTYNVTINTSGILVSENDVVVSDVATSLATNTWFNFAINADATGISVMVNDALVAEYTAALTIDANFSVTTNTNVMLDNLIVDVVGTVETTETLSTPTPETLTDESASKLGGIAEELMNAYLIDGDEAVAELLATTDKDVDEEGRVLVDILSAKTSDGATVAQIVTDAGGVVTRVHSQSIEAYVNVSVLFAITNNENIRFIRNVNRATSTGPVGNNGESPLLPDGITPNPDYFETWTEGYNLLSAEEWHLAGVTGQDVNIGVIDTGFLDADSLTQRNGNLSCLADTTPVYNVAPNTGLGSTTHGTEVIEVICDLAPNANVYMFRADSVASVRDAISAGRGNTNRMDVMLITLDLGVNTSAGGGQSGNIDENVYGEIEAAKDDGMVIIAAAGNNNKRMLVLRIDPGSGNPNATTINITGGSIEDEILFGWNDFDDNGISKATINASVAGGGSGSSSDPLIDPMSFSIGVDGTATLSIDPASVAGVTYLQVQIVPADPTSSVEFDYSSISLDGDGLTEDYTDQVGNLGRPADSDSVISVGAICARTDVSPSRWEYSSNGPRFNTDGTPLSLSNPLTRSQTKPTLMSYAFVTTSEQGSAPEGPPPDADGLLTCTDGFGGTSAAAAHVTGMVALIMSNDSNETFADMNEANAFDGSVFTDIRNYLQARSVDLPLGAEANGFDSEFGSGLAILGAPSYDLTNTNNPGVEANQLPESCSTGNTYYVGQGNLGNTGLNGNVLTPFTSIAAALNAPNPDCIIVMPGEYVSPLRIENSYTDPLLVTGYSDVSRTDVGDVIFWLRGASFNPDGEYEYGSDTSTISTYRRRAGLYFSDNSANIEFSGFTFIPARFYTDSNGINNTTSFSAVIMDGSTNTTISNSQFGKITVNGVTYPGWFNINATPIQILNSASGSRVENNIFNENSTVNDSVYPTVAIINSGQDDNPVIFKNNEVYGNRSVRPDLSEWSAILYSDSSYVDIINNAFYENDGETIIKVATTPPQTDLSGSGIAATHTRHARIVGNVFLNNTTITDSGLKQAGALINARYTPMIYIINNTMVGNNIPSTQPFGEMFSRGNTKGGENEGSNPAGWDFWEIHNNLIYDNTFYQLVGDTEVNRTRGCHRIPNDSSDSNLYAFGYAFNQTLNLNNDPTDEFDTRGAQNNWIVSNTIGSGFGDCQVAIATNKTISGTYAYDNRNIIETDNQPVNTRSSDDSLLAQDGDFQGQDITIEQPYTVSDWQYYALVDTYIDADNSSLNEYSDGIDAGGDRWLTDNGGSADVNDPYMDGADITFDIIGTRRPLDVNNWEINWISDPDLSPPRGISGSDNNDFTLDIGAFEFSPLQFETQEDQAYYDADVILDLGGGNIVPAVTEFLREDLEGFGADYVTFDLSTVVTGGFGELTFSIAQDPNNYGTQCGSQFEDTRGLVQRSGDFDELFDYCPPANFYTNDGDSFTNNDYVNFKVMVRDEAGAFTTGEVRFTILPDAGGTGDDSDFLETTGVAIGDELIGGVADESDLFEVVTTLGTEVNIRLRPYVRFGNFFFSENSNPEFETVDGRKLVDYPFSYSIDSITDPDGIIVSTDTTGLPDSPIIGVTMSDEATGIATIEYSVTDAGGTSTGNILTIRSVSIVPDKGIHDDTSFIWNYTDSTDALFFSEINGFDQADTPVSGDWIAERSIGAINDTLHTTSTSGDTATFRFIGSGFTIFMRGGDAETGGPFTMKVFDDLNSDAEDFEVDLINLATSADWVSGTATNMNTLQINLNDSGNPNLSEDVNNNATEDDTFVCTTRASVNTLNPEQLVHDKEAYTITCEGLPRRVHTVQIINQSDSTLSVDAFSIIDSNDQNFTDAGPIGPGFHDIDHHVLQFAFNGQWSEELNSEYSNGIGLTLAGSTDVSFDIERATGFSIGTAFGNGGTFNVCVNRIDPASDGVCNTYTDDGTTALYGIHIPFYGLDPQSQYTVSLTGLDDGFVFDDLVVYNDILRPFDNLPVGETLPADVNLIKGEPFNDDWVLEDGKLSINEDRSAIGPFLAFQMDDNIDLIGIKVEVPPPPVVCPRRGPCPEPEPSGVSELAVCVNRSVMAHASGTNFGNCVMIDATVGEYEYVDSTTGLTTAVSTTFSDDGTIFISETTLFDALWGDNTTNTVEIFSLYPDSDMQFESITLLSSSAGLGEGSYTINAPAFSYVQYDRTTNTYSDVELDDGSGAFTKSDITECSAFDRRGNCAAYTTVGTAAQTSDVGNAVVFKMLGTGLRPEFVPTENSVARMCVQKDDGAFDGFTTTAEIATEIQTNGDCQILNLSEDIPTSQGMESTGQYVMIELLQGLISTQEVCVPEGRSLVCTMEPFDPTMNFIGVTVTNSEWQLLDALTVGNKYETSYLNRIRDNMFAYSGPWSTIEDPTGQHSGSSYDKTSGEPGASIIFKTTGGNGINIIRDLKDEIEPVCGRRGCSTLGEPGYSDIQVCVAPLSNPNDRSCAIYSSSGTATQVSLPISLNDEFVQDDYLVSISAVSGDGFVIDAVEVFDTTSTTMTAGIYQENSEYISYTLGQSEFLKHNGFETHEALLDSGAGEDWDWNITTGISHTITEIDKFAGSQSLLVDANNGDTVQSEVFNIEADGQYTIQARVKVVSGTVEMRSSNIVTQANKNIDKWELMRYTFEASASGTDQIQFVATTDGSRFFIDDVHVYEGGSWNLGDGGQTDGRIAKSVDYGSKATFKFYGTGFTVRLASDNTSGETRVCYANVLALGSLTCFTYDNEQPIPEPVCTGGRRPICTIPDADSTTSHTVDNLPEGTYIASVEQMDNGMQNAPGEDVCTGGRRPVCTPGSPPNSPNEAPTSVKIDSIQILNNATALPLITAGTFNENATFDNIRGIRLLPSSNWSQQFDDGTNGYTENSYYQANENAIGSMFMLKVDNTDPATIVIDMNEVNEDATEILACTNTVEGILEFNGTNYDILGDTNCIITDVGTTQGQLVFNQNNLPNLDGVADDETTLIVQSLSKSNLIIDGYQVLYGTTLIEGRYEDTIGYGTTNSILTVSSISGTDDWKTVPGPDYSGGSALLTGISGTNVSFSFEGTGMSLLMGGGESTTICVPSRRGEVCTTTENPLGQLSIELTSDICNGSCHDELNELGAITRTQGEPGAITIAGLPNGLYTVTLRAYVDESLNENIALDAIEIFGDLQQLGSLYDDAQVDLNGQLLLKFGPTGSTWSTAITKLNGDFLNDTYHASFVAGANVSFEVGNITPAEAIIIYDGNPPLPEQVCVPSRRGEICEPLPYEVPSSSEIEVCWNNLEDPNTLDRSCETVTDLDDGRSARRVSAPISGVDPVAGNYNISITNKASGEPMFIDAIQVVEEGLMTEGIYEEDYFSPTFSPVSNTSALNNEAIQLNNSESVDFTFDGVAFSVLVAASGTDSNDIQIPGSDNYEVCVYAGSYNANGCDAPTILESITRTSHDTVALTYGGLHNGDGSDNAQWTVVITNNDASNPLYIDRVDILGNNNDLTINDNAVYEAGQPQIRYLPFGSWTESSEFKEGSPFNGSRFDTQIPGAVAYFEFVDDGVNPVGIEYVRQVQTYRPYSEECIIAGRRGCTLLEITEELPAYATANVCYGEVGDPSSKKCESFNNSSAAIFEVSGNTEAIVDEAPENIDCTNGCWAVVEYGLDSAVNSLTPLDYIRLYDPNAPLSAGTYQENHPTVVDSGNTDRIEDSRARVGFYELVSGTAGESYFYFPFEGTGLSARLLAGENAEEVSICIIDYTGGSIPSIPADIPADEDCLNSFINEQETEEFVTRAVHGLDHNASYMAIIKMNSDDGTTFMGLDQVTIYGEQWFVETDFTDSTYLNLLEGGDSEVIDFKTRDTDKIARFLGNWQTIREQIYVGCTGRRCSIPIYETEEGDRGLGAGSTILVRSTNANAVTFEYEVDGTATVQMCALPVSVSGTATVDISSGENCQTFNSTGRVKSSFVYSDTSDPHVITLQLLSNDSWISVYNVAFFDVTNGLGAGLYDDLAPGISYATSVDYILNEKMEDEVIEWQTIGSSTTNVRAGGVEVCVEGRRGITCTLEAEPTLEVCVPSRFGETCTYLPEPSVEVCVPGRRGLECTQQYQEPPQGNYSRKIVANIGQGLKHVGALGTGVALQSDTAYTAIARVFLNESSLGSVKMQIVSGTQVISEIEGLDLSTSNTGKWQSIRADFVTTQAYPEAQIQFVVTGGKTTFFLDDITITTGGDWGVAESELGPEVCSGGRRPVCVPGEPLVDLYGDTYSVSQAPGSSFSFDFYGTGFELGLIGGNTTGDVEVCYNPTADDTDVNCMLYSQDDAAPSQTEVCVEGRRGITCTTEPNTTFEIAGRGIAGLPLDKWTVTVREIDNLYSLADSSQTRYKAEEVCTGGRRPVCTIAAKYFDTIMGLDYIYIYDEANIASVPVGLYNEDASDSDSGNDYLALFPSSKWATFAGSGSFSQKTYVSPADGSVQSTTSGPVAMLEVNVPENDGDIAVMFQFGGSATDFAETLLICVDETNGEITWDGNQFVLENSDNCILSNNAIAVGQASVTSEDIEALNTMGTHNVTITALSGGNFRIDGYQLMDDRILTVGLHNESLPSTILDFGPEPLSSSATCNRNDEWCYNSTKTVLQEVCIPARRGFFCSIQPVTTAPYVGSAATTSREGATLNFLAQGTGFSIISDVDTNGLDFRVCYKLASSDTSFPVRSSSAEIIALSGIDGEGLPVLVSEGGVLCESLTSDADNWESVMSRPLGIGARYGFSFYGLPFNIYDVQVMVTRDQNSITEEDWFTIDAINVFSDSINLTALTEGITDDNVDNISYEPDILWDTVATTNTYENSETKTDNAGAISQFRVDGNSMVLYQSVGDMTSDAQLCLIISNENIHCTVEAERQTRLARQVTNFTQAGADVEGEVCIPTRRGFSCSIQIVEEEAVFTPVVFYGLGVDRTHKVIIENREHGKIFNIDAIQVFD